MTGHSKYYYEAVGFSPCQEIVHNGTCWDSLVWNFVRTIPGCIKFVLPLALVIMQMNFCITFDAFKHIYPNRFQSLWKSGSSIRMYFGKVLKFLKITSWVLGLLAVLVYQTFAYSGKLMFGDDNKATTKHLFSVRFFWSNCRNLLGYFHYYTVLGIPSGLGAAISSIALSDRAVYHYAHGLSTVVSNTTKWLTLHTQTEMLQIVVF